MNAEELYNLICEHPHGGMSTTGLVGRVEGSTLKQLEDARLIYIGRASTPVRSMYDTDGTIELPGERYPACRLTLRSHPQTIFAE